MSLLDPNAFLSSASPKGASIFVPNGQIQDMTEPTLVHGWIDWSVVIQTSTVLPAAAGYLAIGLHVIPTTVSILTDIPGPFSNADGDWLYHRVVPLFKQDGAQFPNTEGYLANTSSVRVHDEVKSARKLHEDDIVSLVYELVDADVTGIDINCFLLACYRYLLRQP